MRNQTERPASLRDEARHAPLWLDGGIAGAIGAASVAFWFVAADAWLHRAPLFAASLLADALGAAAMALSLRHPPPYPARPGTA